MKALILLENGRISAVLKVKNPGLEKLLTNKRKSCLILDAAVIRLSRRGQH
jgi:hypothetical protein